MGEKSFLDRKIAVYAFLNTVIKRWYIIAIPVIISIILSTIYALTNITPLYTSASRLYIIDKNNNTISSSELAISTSLAKDFQVIINDNSIVGEVAKQLNYEYTASQIKEFISVSNPEGTRIIELKVISDDEAVSKKIDSAICKILQERIIDIMGIDRISVISQGNLSRQNVVNKQVETVIYSVLITLFISLTIIGLISVSNTKVTSAKEIEDVLGLSVLATIPYNKNKSLKSKN